MTGMSMAHWRTGAHAAHTQICVFYEFHYFSLLDVLCSGQSAEEALEDLDSRAMDNHCGPFVSIRMNCRVNLLIHWS